MTKYDTQGAFDKLGQDPFLPPAPAPRKSRKGWVIAGLLVAAIGIGSAVSEDSADADLGSTAPVIEATIDDGLTSFDGVSVEEMAGYVIGTSEHETMCSLTPIVGYDEARQTYLDAYPQIGSDAYEGAVFDEMMDAC